MSLVESDATFDRVEEAIAEIAAPAMKHHFMALERSPDAIDWDPI